MRYVRKQFILSVVTDENIDDLSSIKDLVKALSQAKTDVSITFRKDKMEQPTSYDRVRIEKLEDQTFDIVVLHQTHTFSLKKIAYDSIDYLCSVVTPSEIFRKKSSPSKGDVLDLA